MKFHVFTVDEKGLTPATAAEAVIEAQADIRAPRGSITPMPDALWYVEYSPYTSQDGAEIPAYEILNEHGEKVAHTNEDMRADAQERVARLLAAAPEMAACLRLAQGALNTAPRFKVGVLSSYDIVARLDRALQSIDTRPQEQEQQPELNFGMKR